MKKSYKLANLGCANCAAKMENDIAKLDGVEETRVAFMTSRLSITTSDDADFDSIVDKAQDIITRYENDCRIIR